MALNLVCPSFIAGCIAEGPQDYEESLSMPGAKLAHCRSVQIKVLLVVKRQLTGFLIRTAELCNCFNCQTVRFDLRSETRSNLADVNNLGSTLRILVKDYKPETYCNHTCWRKERTCLILVLNDSKLKSSWDPRILPLNLISAWKLTQGTSQLPCTIKRGDCCRYLYN